MLLPLPLARLSQCDRGHTTHARKHTRRGHPGHAPNLIPVTNAATIWRQLLLLIILIPRTPRAVPPRFMTAPPQLRLLGSHVAGRGARGHRLHTSLTIIHPYHAFGACVSCWPEWGLCIWDGRVPAMRR